MLSDGLVKLRITKPRRELLGQLGIVTVEDLLTYYPYRYEIMEAHRPTAEDPSLVMEGVLLEKARLAYRRQNQSKMLMRVVIDQQIYQVAIFNRHFLLAKLGAGQVVTVIGKLSGDHQIVASDLKLQPLASLPAITPVYSVKEGITSKAIANYVKKALEALDQVQEAQVSHEAGTAVVTLAAEVADDVLKKAVEDQDYKVLEIA